MLVLFESLKKKLSKTSEKLEEELVEEAKNEDNIEEESGDRFSFFSFGRNNKEEEENSLSGAGEIPEEVEEEIFEEEVDEEKSHFWKRDKKTC